MEEVCPGRCTSRQGSPGDEQAPQAGQGHPAHRDRRARHRPQLLGQALVRAPGIVLRLRQPPAARADLRAQRLRLPPRNPHRSHRRHRQRIGALLAPTGAQQSRELPEPRDGGEHRNGDQNGEIRTLSGCAGQFRRAALLGPGGGEPARRPGSEGAVRARRNRCLTPSRTPRAPCRARWRRCRRGSRSTP